MNKDSQDQNKDKYKDTVFLPKTDFPMRGGLPQKEPEILQKWQEMDLYDQMREASKDKKKWILHDGPPYANGNIHMGHALNKILKDVVVKSYAMLGYNTPYVPGWDCHGLPIEWKIEEKYRNVGKDKDDVEPLVFRDECRKFAQEWVDTQSAQFQRLGVTGDWKNPYLTMTKRAEGKIVREIHKFVENGGLYKGAKPVMWSTVEKTALAEAEVEYKEHKSITIWIRFPVVETKVDLLKGADIVIWTTTPWTMPSNRAIAFGENMEYGVYEVKALAEGGRAEVGAKIAVSTALAEDVKANAKIEDWECLSTFKGAELAGTICHHPLRGSLKPSSRTSESEGKRVPGPMEPQSEWIPASAGMTARDDAQAVYDFDVPALPADFVTEETGTGFVHIAPGHGEDDFYLGTANGIEVTDNVADDGKFRDHVPLFAGLEVYTQEGKLGDGNFAVLKAMDEAGALLAKGSLRHEYPHSWRSKAPLIFRTTPQWFIAMDTPLPNPPPDRGREEDALASDGGGDTLRARALQAISETAWVPAKGEARIRSMIAGRPDWCISRQRAWGVPIALFVHKDTDEVLSDPAVLGRIGEIFEKEGSDAWWSRSPQDFLGNDYNAEDYTQIFDIVDVWFESGSTHAFVCEDREDLQSPADLYLEGSDQHRGWFHSSLLESVGTRGQAPFKSVLTHGFVLDEKGYKMSKSDGNVVDPLKMMEQYGADILRLWTLTSDFSEDIRIGKDSLKSTGDLYRRIRNTLRFLLGALEGYSNDESVFCHSDRSDSGAEESSHFATDARSFDFARDDIERLPELERLMLHQLTEMDQTLRTHIENYDFMKLTKALHDFCNEELSAFYFDIRKDRLYCDDPAGFERRATRTVMAEIFKCLVSWLAPVLAFTAEEAWSHRPAGVFGDEESIHLRTFPEVPQNWQNEDLADEWVNIRRARKAVLEKIEPLRASKELGSSLEAEPLIRASKQEIESYARVNMADVCITAPVKASEFAGFEVEIQKAPGDKCTRCWKVLPEVAGNGDLCNRCTAVVKQAKAA